MHRGKNNRGKVITMCGRYYIDSDMADEIEKVVHDIDQRIRQEHFAGDIFPTNVASIIEKSRTWIEIGCLQVGISIVARKESGYKCKSRICYGQTLSFSEMEFSITVY